MNTFFDRSGIRRTLAATILAIAPGLAPAQWSGAPVDTLTRNSVRDLTTTQSLAVDDANTVHAVWMNEQSPGSWRILHAKRTQSGSWTLPEEAVPMALAPRGPALAVHRSSGRAYIAFTVVTALSDELFLASDSGGIWQSVRITSDTLMDTSPTVAIDAAGKVHLACITQDSTGTWRIRYATNLSGTWQRQILAGSDLGPFGSGAAPFIVVTPDSRVHLFYRGGDFGSYHIHHAYNSAPGGTAWTYEILSTPNGNDFTAFAAISDDGTLHLLASGNDGFGFPAQVYYMKKPAGSPWTAPERANPSASGWGGSLAIDRNGAAHIAWNESSGNIYTGNLFYATNKTGAWVSTPVLSNQLTYNGEMVVDGAGRGTALAYHGNTLETQEIIAIRSTGPLTSVRDDGVPVLFHLEQNYPNPFNPVTRIGFVLGTESMVSLKVYNLIGQEMATLVQELLPAGAHAVEWNGRDGSGRTVSSGVYFYRMEATPSGGQVFSKTLRMIYLK